MEDNAPHNRLLHLKNHRLPYFEVDWFQVSEETKYQMSHLPKECSLGHPGRNRKRIKKQKKYT
jgi:hypothetical protein